MHSLRAIADMACKLRILPFAAEGGRDDAPSTNLQSSMACILSMDVERIEDMFRRLTA